MTGCSEIVGGYRRRFGSMGVGLCISLLVCMNNGGDAESLFLVSNSFFDFIYGCIYISR